MGLLDDLADAEAFRKAQSLFCGVCVLLKELPPAESKLLEQRMADPLIGHTALSRVLKSNGHNISDGVLGRHRRGLCTGVAE